MPELGSQRVFSGFLSLPDNLANIDADERRWRIGHVAELVEGRLRCPGVSSVSKSQKECWMMSPLWLRAQ
jgi:hypothetical protein